MAIEKVVRYSCDRCDNVHETVVVTSSTREPRPLPIDWATFPVSRAAPEIGVLDRELRDVLLCWECRADLYKWIDTKRKRGAPVRRVQADIQEVPRAE